MKFHTATTGALAALVTAAAACGGRSSPSAPATLPPVVVSISFAAGSSCTPLPGKPCQVPVTAEAIDPAAVVSYQWSGCASGTAREAICLIDKPGTVAATVDVRDRQGRTAMASADVRGINNPPTVFIGYVTPTPNSSEITLLGAVTDPDEFINDPARCTAAVTGACRSGAVLHCGNGMWGTEVAVFRLASTGSCTVTITARDSWDARGSLEVTFDVAQVLATRR